MASLATTVPIGVYRSPQVAIAPVQAYESFLGIPTGVTVDYVLAFMADDPSSWTQFEDGILASTTNGPPGTQYATDWAPILGPRKLILAVPACCMGTSWTDEASGINDIHWAALARALVSSGLGNCVLRIAREFNGSGYRWKVNSGNVSVYRAAYARIVQTMRSAGFTGKFCWNPGLGQGTFGPSSGVETAYPGDTSVDTIGLDVYDGDWTGIYPSSPDSVTSTQQQQVWDKMLTEWDSLRGWYNLARGHHKKLCFPEWGLRLWKDAGVWHSGGDNAVFITGMSQFIQGCGAEMHAIWEDRGMGVSDLDNDAKRLISVPQARAEFLTRFGR